ncbi:hypothetical protein ACVWXL_008156 [Bradyrhizobium sp. GM22.5]
MNSLSTGDTLLTVAVMTSAFLDIEQRKSIRHRDCLGQSYCTVVFASPSEARLVSEKKNVCTSGQLR